MMDGAPGRTPREVTGSCSAQTVRVEPVETTAGVKLVETNARVWRSRSPCS